MIDMKRFLTLLLCVFCLWFVVTAQDYKLSNSKNTASKIYPLEKIVNSNTKQCDAKIVKIVNSLIWAYLKNWDTALKNWNYSLAINNYEIAIKNLDGVKWAECYIKMIHQRIDEIRKEHRVDLKVKLKPLNNKTLKSKKYPVTRN